MLPIRATRWVRLVRPPFRACSFLRTIFALAFLFYKRTRHQVQNVHHHVFIQDSVCLLPKCITLTDINLSNTNFIRYAVKNNRELIVWEGFAPQQGQTGRSSHPASSVAIPTQGITVTPFGTALHSTALLES